MVLAVAVGVATQAVAQVYTLTDQNSRAQIDPYSQRGMFDWSIAMPNQTWQNQLNQQWFWYRIGNTPEQSLNRLGTPVVTPIDARSISLAYTSAGAYSVEINYLLTGGVVGSGASDILETIRIRNLGNTALDMHFFQYSDFNLQGSPENDVVRLGRNLRGLFNEASQHDAGLPSGQGLTETVTTPGANHGELGIISPDGSSNFTLDRLNDGLPTVLNDGAGAVGPANVTWALEWDVSIAPGGSLVISKDKNMSVHLIPEPSSFALLSLGVMALVLRKRRQ